MDALINDFAEYVLKLSEASTQTRVADDRPIYLQYLADSGVLLALLVSRADRAAIDAALKSHERLWGHTWLQDDAFNEPASALGKFKERFHAE